MFIKKAKLHYKEETHDKVYHVALEQIINSEFENVFNVLFAYGKRGNNDKLISGKKVVGVLKYKAEHVFKDLVQQKLKKGYRLSESIEDFFGKEEKVDKEDFSRRIKIRK